MPLSLMIIDGNFNGKLFSGLYAPLSPIQEELIFRSLHGYSPRLCVQNFEPGCLYWVNANPSPTFVVKELIIYNKSEYPFILIWRPVPDRDRESNPLMSPPNKIPKIQENGEVRKIPIAYVDSNSKSTSTSTNQQQIQPQPQQTQSQPQSQPQTQPQFQQQQNQYSNPYPQQAQYQQQQNQNQSGYQTLKSQPHHQHHQHHSHHHNQDQYEAQHHFRVKTPPPLYPSQSLSPPVSQSLSQPSSVSLPSDTKMEHGLTNNTGQNNCFLNGVLQILWHNEKFRKEIFDESSKMCSIGSDCLICQLGILFTDFQVSERKNISPDSVRKTLSILFSSQKKFQLQENADASECYEAILQVIHENCEILYPNHQNCLSHRNYGVDFIESEGCEKCQLRTQSYNTFVKYFLVQEVLEYLTGPKSALDEILQTLLGKNALRCEHCENSQRIPLSLQNSPTSITLGFIWASYTAPKDQIRQFMGSLTPTIDLQKPFFSMGSVNNTAELQGFICYYGAHYVAFHCNLKNEVWTMFDDTLVKEVGNFQQVQQKCVDSHFQPTIMFFERKMKS